MTTQRLFGLDFESTATAEQVADRLLGGERGGDPRWQLVVTPNVDHLVRYEHAPDELALAMSADLVLPDGMPIVWASRLLRRPIAHRVAGSDLFVLVWTRLHDQGRPVVALASGDEVAARLRLDHPGSSVLVAPLFDVSRPGELADVAAELAALVDASGAEIVLLGIGAANAHRLAAHLLRCAPPAHGAATVLLVGASAEFHVGLQHRAPQWMRRTGLEWAYRLLREPRRLARRYLVDDLGFVKLVWRERRAIRREGPR